MKTFSAKAISPPVEGCQLCGGKSMTYFPIGTKTSFWHCATCNLYQYGQLVETSAYQGDYHAGYARHKKRKIRTAMYRLARVASYLEVPSPKILEVGCSIGSTLIAGKRIGWEMTGVDVDPSVVDYCRESGLDASYIDRGELPFNNNTFDAVVAWHVIEHVADVRKTLSDWIRVLKPGGLLVVETPDAEAPKVKRLGAAYEKFWAAEHTYTFTFANLARFATQAGLEILPEPSFGRLSCLPLSSVLQSAAYRSFVVARKWLGGEKAFQLFARKPNVESFIRKAA